MLYNYYREQFERIQPGKAGSYAPTIVIKQCIADVPKQEAKTNHISLNDESAAELVRFLNTYYHTVEKGDIETARKNAVDSLKWLFEQIKTGDGEGTAVVEVVKCLFESVPDSVRAFLPDVVSKTSWSNVQG